jgi:phage tail tape measure protein, TP901 family
MALISDRTKEQLMAAKQNEAKIIFTAETKEFSDAIKKSSRDIEALKSELRLNAAEMKNNGTSITGLTKRQSLLHQELEAQKSKTRNLNEELQKAKSIYGSNSVEVNNLTKQLNTSKVAEQNIEREIKTTNTALEQQKKQSEAVATAQKGLKKGLDAVSKASGALSGASIAAGAGAVKLFTDVKQGSDAALKATGATGKAAEEVKQSYKNVASSVKGDFGDIGATLGEVETRFEFTGKAAEDCTTKFIKFGRINNIDATQSVQLVSRAMGDAGIDAKKYSEVLDALTVAAQGSGIGIAELTTNLTKYGAPMRALGFDIQESIALFAQWEKAGVNTSIAFSGMKKAISNWGKEGKDGRVEFQKTLEEIKKAPNIASATTKAIEVFGSKAGPDLADAIQNGRFEYGKFLKTIKNSKGAVNRTAKEISSGVGKSELAIQNLKLAGAEAGEALITQLEPDIKKVLKGTQEFAKYAETHGEEIADTIKTIGVVAGTAFAINKVVKFGNSLVDVGKGVYTVVGAVQKMAVARAIDTTATEAETVAQVGLNTAMKANIFIGVAAAVGTLAYALYQATTRTQEQSEEVKKAIEVRKEFKNSVEDATTEVDKEYQTYDRYMYQLDKYIDKNGKIKKGYKDRVEVIRKDLKDSFGIEMNIINGTVQGWQNVRKSIQDVIATEKAKAYMDSQKDNYNEALSGQAEYSKKLADNSKLMSDTVEKLSDAKLELKALEDDANSSMKDRTDAAAKVQKLEDDLAEYQQRHAEYSKTYAQYSNNVKNYESLTTAVASGSTKKINSALAKITYDLKSASTADKETLEKQVEDTRKTYEYLAEEYKKGTSGITKEQVEIAKKAYNISVAECKKAGGKYVEAGKESGKKYSNGFKVGVEEFFTLNPVDVSMNIAVKNKGVNKKVTSIAGIPSIMKIPQNAEGGIYAKGAFVTSFAEESAEAAIPLNNKPRSIALYKQAGEIMGLNRDTGNINIKNQIEVSETNSLLKAILKKDNNLYVNADRLNERTESSRNRTDGIKYALQGRGLAIE